MIDPMIGGLDRVADDLSGVEWRLALAGLADDLREHLDDQGARGFASPVPAHSVRDDVQAQVGERAAAVLVLLSFSADIRGVGDVKAHRSGSAPVPLNMW